MELLAIQSDVPFAGIPEFSKPRTNEELFITLFGHGINPLSFGRRNLDFPNRKTSLEKRFRSWISKPLRLSDRRQDLAELHSRFARLHMWFKFLLDRKRARYQAHAFGFLQ